MNSNNLLLDDPDDPFVSKAQRKKRPQHSPTLHRRKPQKPAGNLTPGKVLLRTLLVLVTVLLCAVITVFTAAYVLVNGECEALRDRLVLSAMQASATKWLPGVFMPQSKVDEIVANSHIVNTDVMSLEEYAALTAQSNESAVDEWANAKDGMLLETVNGPTFTGYVLLVKDPSRVFVGTSSDFTQGLVGMKIFDMAKKENAVAVINAGEFADPGGQGTGNNPMGITYSKGKCVWNDSLKRTFIGFDKDNRLVVTEPMDKATAEALGIRDGVSFQNGNVLITNENGSITMHYADSNTGTAQRTAIGQKADGTVILLVTDGRSASSLGATRGDVIDVMIKYGAVSAGMLDGGSSSLMYYEDYYTKYGIDESTLDEYQKMGLVNRYKAFTTPRRMPTYICVAAQDDAAVSGGEQAHE
ncbi:MAG: phosphodiester glycosidase family protein [Eubacteriales bacterium]